MRGTERRGFAMVMALFIIGILLVVVILLLGNSSTVAVNAFDVQDKNQITDAANAGLDAALDALDSSSAATTCTGATINTYSFTCGIYNNFAGGSNLSVTDVRNNTVVIPPGLSMIYGQASSSAGSRRVTVEALVSKPSTGALVFPPGALDSAGDISSAGPVTVTGDNSPAFDNGSTYANGNYSTSCCGSTVTVHGKVNAHGTASGGWAGMYGTLQSQPVYAFPTGAQADTFANNAKTVAQSGTTMTPAVFMSTCNSVGACNGNIYVNGTINSNGTKTYTIGGGGTLYVDGNIQGAGNLSLVNALGSTVVVNGNVSYAGSFNYSVTSGSQAVLEVLGPSGMSFAGSGKSVGIVWAPYGTVSFAGGASMSGKIISGNGDTCNYNNGCAGISFATSGFTMNYKSNLTFPGGVASNSKFLAYGEY